MLKNLNFVKCIAWVTKVESNDDIHSTETDVCNQNVKDSAAESKVLTVVTMSYQLGHAM
jgi:hypothetical protein